MKFLIIFLSSFLFANELYINLLENTLQIEYLNKYSFEKFKISPDIKKIIQKTPDKFFIGNANVNTLGDKKASIGIEFDFHKKNKTFFITNNKKIFDIDKTFAKNQQIILCYKNFVLFNLKRYLTKVKKTDNFYSKYLLSLKNIKECKTKKQLIFFYLKKEKTDTFSSDFILQKRRKISSNLMFNINQNKKTYLSASFNIKIPLEKTYTNDDITKLQQINSSLNKIYNLIININNKIDTFNLIKKQNKILLNKIKLLTVISKFSPSNINFDKLISVYNSYFNNLLTLNQLQNQIFINKFLLKSQKRILSEY